MIFLVNLIVGLIIIGLVYGLLKWLLGEAGLPAPLDRAVRVLLVLLVILWTLDLLGVAGGPHFPHVRW